MTTEQYIINFNQTTHPQIVVENNCLVEFSFQNIFLQNQLPIIKTEISYGDGEYDFFGYRFDLPYVQDSYIALYEQSGSSNTTFSHKYTNNTEGPVSYTVLIKTVLSDFSEKTFDIPIVVQNISTSLDLLGLSQISVQVPDDNNVQQFINKQLQNGCVIPSQLHKEIS